MLLSRPVYFASMAHGGKKNIITIGMFAFFSGTPSLMGIGVHQKADIFLAGITCTLDVAFRQVFE